MVNAAKHGHWRRLRRALLSLTWFCLTFHLVCLFSFFVEHGYLQIFQLFSDALQTCRHLSRFKSAIFRRSCRSFESLRPQIIVIIVIIVLTTHTIRQNVEMDTTSLRLDLGKLLCGRGVFHPRQLGEKINDIFSKLPWVKKTPSAQQARS